jgi:hypothetical protein
MPKTSKKNKLLLLASPYNSKILSPNIRIMFLWLDKYPPRTRDIPQTIPLTKANDGE